jgi:ribonuclease Z
MKLTIGLTLRGHSRGSEKTGFYIPELKTFLDAGLQSYFCPENILITHCHSDHSFALPMLLLGLPNPPNIYVPKEHEGLFIEHDKASTKLFCGIVDEHKFRENERKFIGVAQDDIIDLGKKYFAKVLSLDHSVPTNGYCIYKTTTKLKKEYQGLKGADIAELRKKGTELSDVVIVPQLAYLCDTCETIYDKHQEIFNYPYIMAECTFLEDETYELAKQSKHTHWKNLEKIINAHPNNTFILIHFSMRYDDIKIPNLPKNAIIWDN